MRWLRSRFHSASMVRIHWARSGTSISSMRSSAMTHPSSLFRAESQSWRFISTRTCRGSRYSARSLTSISEQGNRGPSAQLCQHLTCTGLLANRAQLVEDCQRAMENGRCFGIATARHERLRERLLGAGCLPRRPEVGERFLGALEEWEGVIQVLGTCGGPALQPIGEGGQRDGAAGKGVRPGALDNLARVTPSLLEGDDVALRFQQQRPVDPGVQDLIVREHGAGFFEFAAKSEHQEEPWSGAVSAKFVDVRRGPEKPPRETRRRLLAIPQLSLRRARRSERSIPIGQSCHRDNGPRAAVQQQPW